MPQEPRQEGECNELLTERAGIEKEFIRFLNDVERTVPAGKLIEAVVDNYATHKHPKVKAWLERHPRWTFHFTPTSGSWLNAVESFFSILTRKRIRRGSFHSPLRRRLEQARRPALAHHDPRATRLGTSVLIRETWY